MVYTQLPSGIILNLRSPRHLPEIVNNWRANRPWSHPLYEPLRDLIEKTYVSRFNAACGYFELLEQSIIEEGFRNPVVVTAGRMQVKQAEDLPANFHDRITRSFFLEFEGGARLYVAQRLGLAIPAIVNDFHNLVPTTMPLVSIKEVSRRFLDEPGIARFNPDGSVYLANIPHTHLPVEKRSAIPTIRRLVVDQVRKAVRTWLRARNDGN